MSDEVSSFDPAAFLDATTTEALVRRPPLPVGDYVGITGEIKSRAWTSNKPDAKVKSGIAFDVPVQIDVTSVRHNFTPEMQKAFEAISSVTLTAGVMIDLNEAKSIDWSTGKNGALRRWRQALKMNNPGETFSPRQMQGRQVLVKVKHRLYEGEAYDEIDSVAEVK
jgi:hypothetical protein